MYKFKYALCGVYKIFIQGSKQKCAHKVLDKITHSTVLLSLKLGLHAITGSML